MNQYQFFDTKFGEIMRLTLIILIVLLSLPISWASPQDSVRINPINPSSGANSIYQISFVARDILHSRGAIAITFPEEFNLSELKMANSTTINGGFKVSVERNKVILQRTGLGRKVMPNESVEIKFAVIKNPPEFTREYQAKVEFLDDDSRIQRSERVGIRLRKNTSKLK